jgi:hypothetical protein
MAIAASEVALTIPTRGDVDLEPILSSLPDFKEVLVWDNSKREDLKVYGRYQAIQETDAAVIATQDDDAIVPWDAILAHYEPGRLVANMDKARWGPGWGYPDSTLVGWGAVFDRELPDIAFTRFGLYSHRNGAIAWGTNGMSTALFDRTCDVIFSALTPRTIIDVGYRHLPWAEGPGRMWTSGPNHSKERDAMLDLCRQIRTWPDDDIRVA